MKKLIMAILMAFTLTIAVPQIANAKKIINESSKRYYKEAGKWWCWQVITLDTGEQYILFGCEDGTWNVVQTM